MDTPIAPLPAFGRRSQPATRSQSKAAFRPVASRQSSARAARRPAAPPPLIIHYSWRMALLGLSVLSIGWKLSLAGLAMYGDRSLLDVASLLLRGKGGDGAMFVLSGLFAGLIGLAWLMQGLTRGRALTLDAAGVCGFTVLGTKRFAWADVDRVEIGWHGTYKRQLTIHGKVGAPSVGYGVTGIPVALARLDCREADIRAAIEAFAPDVPIVDLGGAPNWLVRLLMMLAEQIGKHTAK